MICDFHDENQKKRKEKIPKKISQENQQKQQHIIKDNLNPIA
jgi:hypothetical protein